MLLLPQLFKSVEFYSLYGFFFCIKIYCTPALKHCDQLRQGWLTCLVSGASMYYQSFGPDQAKSLHANTKFDLSLRTSVVWTTYIGGGLIEQSVRKEEVGAMCGLHWGDHSSFELQGGNMLHEHLPQGVPLLV